MKGTSRITAVCLALALVAHGPLAQARVGSSSSSSGKSAPAPARAAPVSKPAAPAARPDTARVQSGGMKRSDVMAQAREQSPQRTLPAPAQPMQAAPARGNTGAVPSGSALAGAAPAPRDKGYSGGQMLGAAAAGAVGGYLLNKALTPSPTPTPAPVAPVQYGTAPMTVTPSVPPQAQYTDVPSPAYSQHSGMVSGTTSGMAPAQGSSGIGFGMVALFLLVMGGLGFAMYRYLNGSGTPATGRFGAPAAFNVSGTRTGRFSSASPAATGTRPQSPRALDFAEDELLRCAADRYRALQDANNAADRTAMTRLVDAGFLPELLADIDARTEPAATRVLTLNIVGNRVLGLREDSERFVGSVHFDALIAEGDAPAQTVEEVWHFVRDLDGGEWKVAGIEAV